MIMGVDLGSWTWTLRGRETYVVDCRKLQGCDAKVPNFGMCMRFDLQDGQGFSFGKIFGAEMSLYWWPFRTFLLQQEGCLWNRISVHPKSYNYIHAYIYHFYCMHIKNLCFYPI